MNKEGKSNLQTYEVGGYRKINPKMCQTCKFAHGKAPFEDAPNKSYCMIYSREEGEQKPKDVYYEGADCEFYEKE